MLSFLAKFLFFFCLTGRNNAFLMGAAGIQCVNGANVLIQFNQFHKSDCVVAENEENYVNAHIMEMSKAKVKVKARGRYFVYIL